MPDLRESLQSTLGSSYTLESELGGGGMSRVFVARDEALGRQVVVKVLPSETAAAISAERFRREIQLAAQLQHPHIVPLLSAGETNGLPYYTMPFVRGDTLRARLMKHGELPVGEAMRILRDVASALAHAHEHGIVHRDIKPENVLISGGSAVVTDFGVAKALTASSGDPAHDSVTSAGIALGTPAYMSPEQASADPAVDARTDIYAFGVLGYELLTGSTLFPGRSTHAVLAAHMSEIPDHLSKRRANVPPGLAMLIMQCLEKRPADRPQQAEEIISRLDGLTTPSGGSVPTSGVPSVSVAVSQRGRRRWLIPAAGALVGAAGLILAVQVTKKPNTALAAAPMVAVLPFENGGRQDDAYIAEGITEAITNRLASVSGLNVIGRQSAKRYAGTDKTPQQIGAELGVSHLLTGTVRWDRAAVGPVQVSIRPALIRVSDGAAIWSQPYDTVFGGVFKLEAQVAERVASALNVALLQSERQAIERAPTTSVAAYEAYMRGRSRISTRTAEGLESAAAHFRKAIQIDPGFARAYAAIAEVYWLLPGYSDASADSVRPLAVEYARRAIALDSMLGSPHATIATAAAQSGQARAANQEFLTAIRLEPRYATSHHWYSRFLMSLGRLDESLREAELARALDPLSAIINANVGMIQFYARRYQEAEQTIRRANARDPGFPTAHLLLGELLVETGRPVEAVAEFDKWLRLAQYDTNRPSWRLQRAAAVALTGDSGTARDALAEVKTRTESRLYGYEIAIAHLVLNEKDSAVNWLLRADAAGVEPMLLRSPRFDPIANDARFQALIKRRVGVE